MKIKYKSALTGHCAYHKWNLNDIWRSINSLAGEISDEVYRHENAERKASDDGLTSDKDVEGKNHAMRMECLKKQLTASVSEYKSNGGKRDVSRF